MIKNRGSLEAKRPAAPLASALAPTMKPPNLGDDDDGLSSLSEPDPEVEIERLDRAVRGVSKNTVAKVGFCIHSSTPNAAQDACGAREQNGSRIGCYGRDCRTT